MMSAAFLAIRAKNGDALAGAALEGAPGLILFTPTESPVRIHVEQLPEGSFLATSGDVQDLVEQGNTVAEMLEIARDLPLKLIEAQRERLGCRPCR